MTPFRWILIWSIIFAFIPVIAGKASFLWYLVGTYMGAGLMIGFIIIEEE